MLHVCDIKCKGMQTHLHSYVLKTSWFRMEELIPEVGDLSHHRQQGYELSVRTRSVQARKPSIFPGEKIRTPF